MANKLIVISVILLVIGAGVYFVVDNQVKVAASEVMDSLEFIDFRLEDWSLFPPSATLIMICSVDNPSNMPLTISFDLDMYAGSDYLTTLVAENEDIRAGGNSIIEIEMSLGTSAVNILSNLGENAIYSISGTFTAELEILGFPITFQQRIDEYEFS